MNEQEQKIVGLLLNEMAFEGAGKHFREQCPVIPEELYDEIVKIEIPQKYDGSAASYVYARPNFADTVPVYVKCYTYLRIIRNNIIHANKAYKPDTPERLNELLDWAHRFIAAVYETGSPFAERARAIKAVMKITSF